MAKQRVRIDGRDYSVDWLLNEANGQVILTRLHDGTNRAVCLCNPRTSPQLYVRRAGKRMVLGRMPGTGLDHNVACDDFDEDTDMRGKQGSEPAIRESSKGYDVSLDVSMSTQAPTTDEKATRKSRSPATVRRSVGLLGLLHYLYRRARLNRFYPAAQQKRDWGLVSYLLRGEAKGGRLAGKPLESMMLVCREGKNENTNAFFDAISPTVTGDARHFRLVTGEVQRLVKSDFGVGLRLVGLDRTVWLSDEAAVARRFENAWQRVQSPGPESRVLLLAKVGVSKNGNVKATDLALMWVNRHYIPVDSSYELRLADHLCEMGRKFLKPLGVEEGGLSPDFLLVDTGESALVMEVWGMNTPEYLQHKADKLMRYREEGRAVWEWNAALHPDWPTIPPVATGS